MFLQQCQYKPGPESKRTRPEHRKRKKERVREHLAFCPLQAWFSWKPGSGRKRDTEGGCSAAGQVASHSPGLRGGDPRSRSSGIGAFWENFLPTNFPRRAQKIHLDSTACNTGPRANAERLCCCPGTTMGGWEPQQQEKHRQ